MNIRSLSSDLLGYYLPSFFFLKVNTAEPLDNLNILSEATLSTLSHEYFHFLQDIFTTNGLFKIIKTVDRLKSANIAIQNNDAKTFTIPFVAPSNSITQLNLDLFSIYEGDAKCAISYNKIIDIKKEENGLIPDYEHVPIVAVYVENTYTGLKARFELGSVCIAESMAFLLEDQLFGNVQVPTVPYRVVEDVCNFILPRICDDRRNLIVLCDIVLNHSHPALLLFDFLNEMKSQNIILTSSFLLYSIASRYRFTDNDSTIGDLYDMTISSAIKSLTDYFTDDYYMPAANWAKVTLNRARELRQVEQFTFIEFVQDKRSGLKRLQRMITEIGTPLMANVEDKYYCLHPQTDSVNQAPLYKAINEVHNILFGYQNGCQLKKYCQGHPQGDLTSYLCDSKPWLNVYKAQLCVFAQVWKMWGLDSKLPERKASQKTG